MPSRKLRKPKRIAPRLASGESRVSIGHGLPPHIKGALIDIAYDENQSVSWVLEQIIIEYFSLETPEYVPVKKEVENEKATVVTRKAHARGRVIPHETWRAASRRKAL